MAIRIPWCMPKHMNCHLQTWMNLILSLYFTLSFYLNLTSTLSQTLIIFFSASRIGHIMVLAHFTSDTTISRMFTVCSCYFLYNKHQFNYPKQHEQPIFYHDDTVKIVLVCRFFCFVAISCSIKRFYWRSYTQTTRMIQVTTGKRTIVTRITHVGCDLLRMRVGKMTERRGWWKNIDRHMK